MPSATKVQQRYVPSLVADGWATLDYAARPIFMRARSKQERLMRTTACAKEPWTTAWILGMRPYVDVFHDIGACVGSYALLAASRGVATVAYEPVPANYAAMVENCTANALGSTLTPLCMAIGPRTGIAPLSLASFNPGSAGHGFGVFGAAGAVATVCVPCYRLDDLLIVMDLPRPSHLLIDVDGAELAVLMGATDTLKRWVRSVMIEVKRQPELEAGVTALLGECGFTERERYEERAGKKIDGVYYALWER